MAEEKKMMRQLKTVFIDDPKLPTLFANVLSAHAGLEEFYLTLGTALPIEIKDVAELEHIGTIEARPFCRFVVTRNVMRQMIDLLEATYNQQTEQINVFYPSQEREEEK